MWILHERVISDSPRSRLFCSAAHAELLLCGNTKAVLTQMKIMYKTVIPLNVDTCSFD